MMTKKEKFKEAVKTFHASKKTDTDYMDFLVIFRSVIAQGSGLTWPTVSDALKEVLEKKQDQYDNFHDGVGDWHQ